MPEKKIKHYIFPKDVRYGEIFLIIIYPIIMVSILTLIFTTTYNDWGIPGMIIIVTMHTFVVLLFCYPLLNYPEIIWRILSYVTDDGEYVTTHYWLRKSRTIKKTEFKHYAEITCHIASMVSGQYNTTSYEGDLGVIYLTEDAKFFKTKFQFKYPTRVPCFLISKREDVLIMPIALTVEIAKEYELTRIREFSRWHSGREDNK